MPVSKPQTATNGPRGTRPPKAVVVKRPPFIFDPPPRES